MSEEEASKEKPAEQTAEEKAAEDKAAEEKKNDEEKSSSLIKETNEAAERLEAANKEQGRLQANARAEKILGGTSEAGSKKLTKDQKEDDIARTYLKGTGFETELFPTDEEKAALKKA